MRLGLSAAMLAPIYSYAVVDIDMCHQSMMIVLIIVPSGLISRRKSLFPGSVIISPTRSLEIKSYDKIYDDIICDIPSNNEGILCYITVIYIRTKVYIPLLFYLRIINYFILTLFYFSKYVINYRRKSYYNYSSICRNATVFQNSNAFRICYLPVRATPGCRIAHHDA